MAKNTIKNRRRTSRLTLDLPEGARLMLRKPTGAKTYLPIRIQFPDGSTTTRWESVLEAYGVDVSDWESPRIVERSTF